MAVTSEASVKSPPKRATREAVPEPTRATAFDRDYWLRHCEGYRVDGTEGRIGLVEEVSDVAGGALLAIRAGKLGRRMLLVPLTEVAFIVPRSQRIWLRTPATIIGSESRERSTRHLPERHDA